MQAKDKFKGWLNLLFGSGADAEIGVDQTARDGIAAKIGPLSNIAFVTNSGNDSTGVIGDSAHPFATPQLNCLNLIIGDYYEGQVNTPGSYLLMAVNHVSGYVGFNTRSQGAYDVVCLNAVRVAFDLSAPNADPVDPGNIGGSPPGHSGSFTLKGGVLLISYINGGSGSDGNSPNGEDAYAGGSGSNSGSAVVENAFVAGNLNATPGSGGSGVNGALPGDNGTEGTVRFFNCVSDGDPSAFMSGSATALAWVNKAANTFTTVYP